MEHFEGKVAVVTGAASGIGLALTRRLLRAGMKVVMADIEAPALDAAVAGLPPGSEVLPVPIDVAVGEQVEALQDATLRHFGAVHVLCNNAGVGGGKRVWETTHKDWEWTLGVNLWGVIHGVRVFAPRLIAQDEGHIVNTASMAGLITVAGLGAYNVSKQGVVALSETLAAELQYKGSKVGVSVLCPGAVSTNIHLASRNRSEALRNPRGDDSEQRRATAVRRTERMAAELAKGQSPDSVADRVYQAIAKNQLYVITHPELLRAFKRRAEAILHATAE